MYFYNNLFVFESVYLMASLIIFVIIIYCRFNFKSDISRTTLLFLSLFFSLIHSIIAKYGVSGLYSATGSSDILILDESFIRNMAVMFFVLTLICIFGLFGKK
ncbi:hypothetical protein EL09_15195 [Salmonella enterica subsp. enterica]|nr:hypothetical protein [Salmonella enterica subsp. enterica]